jgi:hypothetical protein
MKPTFERAEIFAQKRADKTKDKKQSRVIQPTKKYKKD